MADPQPQLSFTAFVISLASTAAIHFGDMADPVSGQRGPATQRLDLEPHALVFSYEHQVRVEAGPA